MAEVAKLPKCAVMPTMPMQHFLGDLRRANFRLHR